MRRVALVAFAAVTLSGCLEAEVIDLEDLRVLLWQPEALAVGSGDLFEDALRVDLTLFVDGEKQDFSLADGQLKVARDGAAEGSDVRVVIETVGETLPDAIARTGTETLVPGGAARDVIAVLAPPSALHQLTVTVPEPRDDVAACKAPDGRVWIVGGTNGAALASGSWLIDPKARALVEGPGLPRARRSADCAWDGADGLFLLGGCDASGVGSYALEHSASGRAGSAFASVGDTADAAGCGARLRRTPQGDLFLLYGDRAQVLSADGTSALTPPEALPAARHHARVLALPGDDVDVLIAGGFSAPAGGTPVAGAVRATVSGSLLSVTPLTGLGGAVFDEGGAPYALLNGAVVAIDESASPASVDGVATLSGVAVSSFAALGEDHFAALAEDGSEIHLLSKAGTLRVPVAPPRPGARLFADPGGALLVVGGGVAGVGVLTHE